jgi:hypothetical protein
VKACVHILIIPQKQREVTSLGEELEAEILRR